MKLSELTYTSQIKLADYCRSGNETQIPGVETERLHHYRRLVYNIIYGNLKQAYPIAYKVLSTEEWDTLVGDFLENNQSKTPKVWMMPFEFYQYVRDNKYDEKYSKPWLNNLLYFEWMEIEVYTMEDVENAVNTQSEGNVLIDLIAMNSEFRLVQLEYPVHILPIAEVEANKGNYFVLLIREPETGRVQFFNLTVLHVWIIEQIVNGEKVFNILDDALELFKLNDKQELQNHVENFLNDLLNKKAFQGFVV